MSEIKKTAWIVTIDETDGTGGVWLAKSMSDAQGLAMQSAQDAGFDVGIEESMEWGTEECDSLTETVQRIGSGKAVEHVIDEALQFKDQEIAKLRAENVRLIIMKNHALKAAQKSYQLEHMECQGQTECDPCSEYCNAASGVIAELSYDDVDGLYALEWQAKRDEGIRSEVWTEAADEAAKEREILFTHEDIPQMDSILATRKQMRNEIVKALRLSSTDGGGE